MPFHRHSKEDGRRMLLELVEKFRRNARHYKSTDYLEADCRAEFLDRMLEALNWDVSNAQGLAPQYREVVMEAQSVDDGGTVNHPDYSLCVGGSPAVFVEAKPPSVKVLDAGEYAARLRQYGFDSGRPLSVLTDFEEFAVYDTRKAPSDGDDAGVSRVKYITFDKYAEEFDYLWDTFSHDAVTRGSIDSYFENRTGKYSVNDVNDEILDAVEEWRTLLVKGAESKGWKISETNINTAVQRLVNRFVHIWRTKGY